ncbi:MAG: NAD-dependent epimerase/dehydratase family protein [Planctomycetota bacterium]
MQSDHETLDLPGTFILVVGGAGFVGSNLVRRLLADGADHVTVVDNLLSAERSNLPADDRVTFIEGSISDDAIVGSLEDEFDFAFHLATFHGNQSSIADPIADHENNTLTSLKLFHRLSGFERLKKVVYSSAGCAVAEKTFEDAEATPEDAPVSLYMDSPYSISKIIGEFYGNYFQKQCGLPFVKARFQNVYGPGEILGAGRWRGTPHTVWRNVTPTFIWKALHGESLPVENNGIATRDFIFVEDIVDGLVRCATRGGVGEIYNLASGRETSIADLATKINEFTGNPGGIEWRPARTWDNSGKRHGAPAKARDEIGFETKISIDEGLERTVAWTRDNMDAIASCIAQHDDQMAAIASS